MGLKDESLSEREDAEEGENAEEERLRFKEKAML